MLFNSDRSSASGGGGFAKGDILTEAMKMRVWGQMIHRQGFTLVELLIAIAVLRGPRHRGANLQNTVINRP